MNVSAQDSGFRWLVLISAVLGYIAVQVANLSVAPVLPQIAESLHLDLGAASNLIMTTFLLSACLTMMAVGGLVCDRLGAIAAIIAGTFCAAAPMALMPLLGHSAAAVAWLRIVEGGSSGFMFPAMGSIIGLWFPERQRGLAGGLMGASVAAGSAAGVLLGPAVLPHVGSWQAMSAVLSVVGWVGFAFAVVLSLLPKPKVATHKGAANAAAFKQALLSPVTLFGALATFMALWGMQCLYNLTPTFLAADKPVGVGYGAMTAGQLMLGVTLLGGILGPVVCGILLDHVFKGNARIVLSLGFVLMAVFVYVLTMPAVTGNVPILEVSLTLAGFGVQFAIPTIYYMIAKVYAPEVVGKMSGIWLGIGTFGGAVGLYVAGITVGSQKSYHTTLIVQSLAAVAGFLLVIALGYAQKSKEIPHMAHSAR